MRGRAGYCWGGCLALVWLLGALPAVAEMLAARTLRVGTILTAADLKATQNMADIDALIGLEVRRAIYAGRPITAADLGPPTLVRRNAIVSVRYVIGGLLLRTEGRALDNGGLGESVRVMNLDTRMTIQATVTGARSVQVRP
ncbi:MAG: flagellar basal body P-ring formation chaperone FlgA [Pseudomonadota bacterium]